MIYGNVREHGPDPGPARRARASRCRASSTAPGCARRRCPTIPPQLAALNRTYANVVELTVRAVLEERPDHVRHAAMLDPQRAATLTLDEIDALCDELTRAHGDLIPAGLRQAPSTDGEEQPMSGISLDEVTKVYPNGVKAVDDALARHRRGRVLRPRRPVRLRQVDAAADDRRPRGRHGRRRSRSAASTSPRCRRRSATSRWSSRTTRSTRT